MLQYADRFNTLSKGKRSQLIVLTDKESIRTESIKHCVNTENE